MGFNFTKAEFDLWAPHYDADAAGYKCWSGHRHVADMVAKHSQSTGRVETVYDLGTGTGLLLPSLREMFTRASIIGVDLSSGMLEKCRNKKLADDLIEFDLSEPSWPFEPKSAQVIASAGMLEFVKDIDNFANNVSGLLQDDGLLIATYQLPSLTKGPISASPTYTRSHVLIKDAFSNAGLVVIEQSRFDAYRVYGRSVEYGIVAARKHDCV